MILRFANKYIVTFVFYNVMLNLFQHLKIKTLKQVQGDAPNT